MENKEKYIFAFISAIVGFVCVYFMCVSFLHIPEGNKKYVDIIVPLLGGTVLGACVGYYVGASPKDGKTTTTKVSGTTPGDTTVNAETKTES